MCRLRQHEVAFAEIIFVASAGARDGRDTPSGGNEGDVRLKSNFRMAICSEAAMASGWSYRRRVADNRDWQPPQSESVLL
jgi:hypothetical protein